MLALPLTCVPIMGKALLLLAKCQRMDIPAPVDALTRDQLVQHLMEHNAFDEVQRYEGLVQKAVNTDEPVSVVIRTKTDGSALAPWWLAGPGDVGLDAVGKIGLIQLAVDILEIKMASRGLKRLGTGLTLRCSTDQMLLTLDICLQYV